VGSRSKEFNWREETQIKDRDPRISNSTNEPRRLKMLWTIFVVLLILWLLGFSLHVAGGLIHLLLVVALVVLVINLVSGRRVA
jgi:hypothetical protein